MLLQNKQTLKTAAGPLIVSSVNPRYFTIGSGNDAERRAVYLTGSHVWNNFHDGQGPGPDCSETPEQFDYDAYLQFLTDHGHNFIRLWRWEQIKSQPVSTYHMCMTPQPCNDLVLESHEMASSSPLHWSNDCGISGLITLDRHSRTVGNKGDYQHCPLAEYAATR